MLASLIIGIVIGTVMGLTGAGGGILAVPALVATMGWSMQQSGPVAMIAVGCSAAIGALEGFRRGLVRYRAALLMALVGIPFTGAGNLLAQRLSQPVLMLLFAGVMLFAAWRMWHHSMQKHEAECIDSARKAGQLHPETGRFVWTLPTLLLVGTIGALTGLMSGLLGVGGGFVIVPMLRRYTNVSMHGIVATSLFLIALVSCGTVGMAIWRGTELPYAFCLYFAAATGIGVLSGRFFSRHMPENRVQQGFALVLIFVAIALIVEAGARIV